MAWRHIVVTNPAKLSLEQGNLVIRQEERCTIPLEDIDVLTVEAEQTTLSAALLGALAEAGAAVFFCDRKHLPVGMLLPLEKHSRQLRMIRRQFSMGKPFQKRLWQRLIRAKIGNQHQALLLVRGWDDCMLAGMVRKVTSGDSRNLEAQAARRYFSQMFGMTFIRGAEDGQNAVLNYGYAILRGMIARHLVNYGFIPALGIHHHSELNPFNLADDLIEPWRPLVDILAALHLEKTVDLGPQEKKTLYGLLTWEVEMGDKRYLVHTGIERMVQSFSSACESEREELLEVPGLSEIIAHGDD